MNLRSIKKTCAITILTLMVLLSGISVAHAEERNIDYTPLVSLPGINKARTTTTTLNTYIPGMFKLSIGVAGVLAVLMIVFGGVEYITAESMGGKKNGQDRINNALIGLVLIIGSYAILSTISPSLLSFDLNVQKVPLPSLDVVGPSCAVNPCALDTACPANNTCVVSKTTTDGVLSCTKLCVPKTTSTATGTACKGSLCYNQYPKGSAWPSDASERASLPSPDFEIVASDNNKNCTTVGQQGCTSLYGIGSLAISKLQELRSQCSGCRLAITAGSEFWLHASHGPGYSVIDMSLNNKQNVTSDALYKFISKGKPSTPDATGCFTGQPSWNLNGAVYILENNDHWHICFGRSIF